ncbi:MAG TPA: DUF3179 domain-containing protein [Acidimicrobiales bacterium]|nr:DUF3179 domain-containing protein [Acidimicrobiales bacterium]
MALRRPMAALALVAVLSGACSRGIGNTLVAGEGGDVEAVALEQVTAGSREETRSALVDPNHPHLPPPQFDTDELRAGGPPPDGIPSVDEPTFLRAGDASFLADDEPVLALEVGREARAYPVQILTWHEIVNDTVAGVPVAVTYCPLCNSAVAYDRRLGDRVLSFGVSGLLHRSALVMFDRQTESLWTHYTGQAIAGTLTGQELRTFPVSTVSWGDWRSEHPDGWVLSRDTGHRRSYGTNPYPGYDDVDTSPFLFEGRVDDRLAAKTRVLGIGDEEGAVTIVLDELARTGVVPLEVGGRALVAFHRPGTASALDHDTVAGGRDVGATGVFDRKVDGKELTFRAEGGSFVDQETGSTWTILGTAVSGPLTGHQLSPVEHVDTFWFAWAAYLPDTVIARP